MKTSKTPVRAMVGSRLVTALKELSDTLDAGKRPTDVFTSRTYDIAEPPVFKARSVRELRESFGASQAVFAKLIGVSLPLVQGWEQGKRTPSPMARRLLEALASNPGHWKKMVKPSATRAKA